MLFLIILVYLLKLISVCVVEYSILQQMLSDPGTLNKHIRGWYVFFVCKFHFCFLFIEKGVSTQCYKGGKKAFCKGILGTEYFVDGFK